MKMFRGEQMACVRGDVLFPQRPRGPSVCLSEPHSASRYVADGAGRLLSHTLPLMRQKHWLLCLFAHLMCVACVLCLKQCTFVFIECVCVIARARAELMCFCIFSFSYPPGSYGRWEPHVRSPFFLCCSAREFISMPFPSRPYSYSHTLTHSH